MAKTGAGETLLQSSKSDRPPSASLSKMAVLPPIPASTGAPGTADINIAPTRAPTPTGAMPDLITDDNVDLFLSKKLALIRHIMTAPDLLDNAEKYEPLCRTLSHGTLKRMNPSLEYRLKLAYLFVDTGFFNFILKYWRLYGFVEAGQWSQIAKSKNLSARCSNFIYMLAPMWNGTDIGDVGYLKRFDDVLRPFYIEILNTSFLYTLVNSELQTRIIRSLLGTLHNMVHKYPNGSSLIRDSGGVNIIGRYISHSDLSTKTKAILVLSYIVNESEQSKLVVTEEHIRYIIGVLADCLKGVSPKHYSRTYGYEAEEVLEGLNHMAVADANKAAIVKCSALPLYAQLLKDDCNDREQYEASQGLWILAFNEQNKRLIMQQVECMQGLKKLTSSTVDRIKRAAQGALWEIEGETKRVQQSLEATLTKASKIAADSFSSQNPVGHIMISYSWGVQPEVIQIKDRLKMAGYKVWIDVEQMSGSTLDAMAASIEEASMVLIFFTEAYKKSPNCRSEAEYCYKIQKPFIPVRMQQSYIADGWLGMVLGTKLFYDFTKPDRWEATFVNLCKAIDQVTMVEPGSRVPIVTPATTAVAAATAATALPGTRPSRFDTVDLVTAVDLAASHWTDTEVRQWLCKHGLQHCCDKLAGFTGVQVGEMKRALLSAPSYFYKVLDQKLGMSLKDTMTFAKILRDLT